MEGLRQKCKCNVLAIAIQHNDTKVLESLPNIDFILKDNIDFVVQLEKENNGNAIAQFILGYCYDQGIVFEKDLSKGVYYYKLAADQNDPSGQNNLGYCYEEGHGVEQDLSKAVYYYKLAADQNDSSGQNNLGHCYDEGIGIEQDLSMAVYYYKLAADQNNANGQNNLGLCYKHGYGIEKDLLKAAYYFKLASDQGIIKAKNRLKSLQTNKDFQDLLLSKYMLLLQEVNELKKENLELRLRPPNIGGPEYEEAKERFINHEMEILFGFYYFLLGFKWRNTHSSNQTCGIYNHSCK